MNPFDEPVDYNGITEECVKAFNEGEADGFQLLERLMNCAGVPMHDPVHHYIMPAVLLALAGRSAGIDEKTLREKLALAEERARKLLPGFCGWWGACGSAVGCGVFASVWLGVSPKKEDNWAKINAFTAQCLAKVASVDGPRCCKRTSYLALEAALKAASGLGLKLGSQKERPKCHWSPYNKECRKGGCPFYIAFPHKYRPDAENSPE